MSSKIVLFAWASVAIVIGMLVLAVGVFTLSPSRLDRRNGTVGRGGWVPGWWQRELDDVLAIQICRGKSDIMNGERGSGSKIYLNYQLNLVFDDSDPTRRNLCENRDRQGVVLTARQLADFLGNPVLNYLGDTPGTLDKVNAEARRVITARRDRSTVAPTLLCLASAAALLLTSCGCPSNASLDQQGRTGIPSRCAPNVNRRLETGKHGSVDRKHRPDTSASRQARTNRRRENRHPRNPESTPP